MNCDFFSYMCEGFFCLKIKIVTFYPIFQADHRKFKLKLKKIQYLKSVICFTIIYIFMYIVNITFCLLN